MIKEIPYETSLIRACVIGQEPVRVHKTYDIRFCFGVQIQTLENYHLLLHAADRPSKMLIRQLLRRATDHERSTNNYHTITCKNAAYPEQMLEDILNPEPTYPEMFPDIFEFSYVDRNLERMLAINADVSLRKIISVNRTTTKSRNLWNLSSSEIIPTM